MDHCGILGVFLGLKSPWKNLRFDVKLLVDLCWDSLSDRSGFVSTSVRNPIVSGEAGGTDSDP
jgi:hypothetical protein